MLVRNHSLCPYSDCVAHARRDIQRIKVLVDEERNVELQKSVAGEKKSRSRLDYKYKLWIIPQNCPFCNRPVEVVIDETHNGRNINIRISGNQKIAHRRSVGIKSDLEIKEFRGDFDIRKKKILWWNRKYDEDYPWWNQIEKDLGEKIRKNKELAKNDLLQMVEWKFKTFEGRMKKVKKLVEKNSEDEIKRRSREVFQSASDSFKVDNLTRLFGVGPALASTILTFYDPEQYGVFDIHVWREIFGKEPSNLFTTKNYLKLLEELRKLSDRHNLQVRIVEKALFKKNIT